MPGALLWFGAAFAGVLATRVAVRLFENAETHYRKELNPEAETGFLSAYKRGLK